MIHGALGNGTCDENVVTEGFNLFKKRETEQEMKMATLPVSREH